MLVEYCVLLDVVDACENIEDRVEAVLSKELASDEIESRSKSHALAQWRIQAS